MTPSDQLHDLYDLSEKTLPFRTGEARDAIWKAMKDVFPMAIRLVGALEDVDRALANIPASGEDSADEDELFLRIRFERRRAVLEPMVDDLLIEELYPLLLMGGVG